MRRHAWWVLVGWLALAASALAADTKGTDAMILQTVDAVAAAPDAPKAHAANDAVAKPSLRKFLDDRGRLAVPQGFTGSLDPRGYSLVSKPGEPPRFAAKNAIDDDARWDPQFGQSIGCDDQVLAMAALPDGRIALGGSFGICGNVVANAVAIWDPVTGRFQSLGTGPANGVNAGVFALAAIGSDVLVGGEFTQAGGISANRVARFNTSTETWSSLGTGVENGVGAGVRALAVAGSDVYVGGGFTEAGAAAANRVARFSAATQTWSSLGAGPTNGVSGCAVSFCVVALAIAGNDLVVGGSFTAAGGAMVNRVARFNVSSEVWSTLGNGAANGVSGSVSTLAVLGSDIYVGGFFSQSGGAAVNSVARFSTATQTWSSLGIGAANGVSGAVFALAVVGSELYVGGFFSQAGGVTANGLARYNAANQTWSSLGTGSANGANGGVNALAVTGSDLYVGGSFSQAGGASAYRVARFNNNTGVWSPLGTGAANGMNGTVIALAVAGSNVYVGGSFTEAGGTRANRVARFDTITRTWSSLGTGAANGLNSTVFAIATAGSDIYVGGQFDQAGGAPANRVARFNTITQSWSSLGNGAENGVIGSVSALAIAGSDIYVAGRFEQAGGVVANSVARFNTATQAWFPLGTGAANGLSGCLSFRCVDAIAVSGSEVYVGGDFNRAGVELANRIARFSTGTQTWSPLGTGAANGVNNLVSALVIAGNDLYVGGGFTEAGGVAANGTARFNMSTQSWSSLGAGTGNGVSGCDSVFCVFALAIDGGDVYVGGRFDRAGGAMANRVARFNASTQTWSPLGSEAVNGVAGLVPPGVSALAIVGTDVYVGGEFTRAGLNVSLRIARYDNRRTTTATITNGAGATVVVNTPITFTGTIATSGFPAQPGAVEFLDNGAVIAGCAGQPLVGGLDVRTATCTTAALPVGAHSVVARYKGDALNFIATSDPVALQVAPPAFAYVPSVLPQAVFNTPGYSSGTITIAAGSGIVSPVAFQVVNASLLPPGLSAAPQPNGLLITGTPTQAGSFTFTVRATESSSLAVGGPFTGDRQYTIVVARAMQTITPITRVDSVPLDNGVAFAAGNFAVQASSSSALPVVIDSTTPTVCQVGTPGFTVQPLQIGTCTLRARQIGNTNFEPAADVLRTFQVKATPDVFVSSAPNPSVFAFGSAAPDPVVLTATVESPAGTAPTGTIAFLRNGNNIAGCAAQPLSGTGATSTATCTTSSLARGANALTAQYSGDALNVLATSNAATHQLNVGTATGIATITPSPCVVGQACTVAVAVASPSGTPTGSVQVGSSSGGSCTVTLASGGGSCALTATTPGPGTVTATYLGSPPWLASPAATQGHPFVATVDELFGNGFEAVLTLAR